MVSSYRAASWKLGYCWEESLRFGYAVPTEALVVFFYRFGFFLSWFFEHAHSSAEEVFHRRRRSFINSRRSQTVLDFFDLGFTGSPSCLMHDRCCDSCPLLLNRDSSGAKKRSMMGFNFFWHISVYIFFQGSNGWAWVWCLSDGGFTVSVSSNWILACSIIDGGGNQFAGAYSISV